MLGGSQLGPKLSRFPAKWNPLTTRLSPCLSAVRTIVVAVVLRTTPVYVSQGFSGRWFAWSLSTAPKTLTIFFSYRLRGPPLNHMLCVLAQSASTTTKAISSGLSISNILSKSKVFNQYSKCYPIPPGSGQTEHPMMSTGKCLTESVSLKRWSKLSQVPEPEHPAKSLSLFFKLGIDSARVFPRPSPWSTFSFFPGNCHGSFSSRWSSPPFPHLLVSHIPSRLFLLLATFQRVYLFLFLAFNCASRSS